MGSTRPEHALSRPDQRLPQRQRACACRRPATVSRLPSLHGRTAARQRARMTQAASETPTPPSCNVAGPGRPRCRNPPRRTLKDGVGRGRWVRRRRPRRRLDRPRRRRPARARRADRSGRYQPIDVESAADGAGADRRQRPPDWTKGSMPLTPRPDRRRESHQGLDLPQTFARLRASFAPSAPLGLTPRQCPQTFCGHQTPEAGLRISPKTASDLHIYFVAGAGFEPATSGL